MVAAVAARPTTLADLMAGQQHLVLCGDVLEMLRRLPDGCVQCVVTSPPYLGLRDYRLPASVWGGDPGCAHQWGDHLTSKGPGSDLNSGFNERWGNSPGQKRQESGRPGVVSRGAFCVHCSAWYGCLGQEPTVELFIEHLVLIFEEVKRVLRPDGCLFVNLGDSYAGSGKGPTGHSGIGDQSARQGFTGVGAKHSAGRSLGAIPTQDPRGLDRRTGRGIRNGMGYELHEPAAYPGLKPKDLMLVPERFTVAMQQAGWWVRSRIAWTKATAMPESVDDRPTSAWEHIWLFTRSRRYFWDKEAVRQPASPTAHAMKARDAAERSVGPKSVAHGSGIRTNESFQRAISDTLSTSNMRNVWAIGPEPSSYDYCGPCDLYLSGPGRKEAAVEVWTGKRWKVVGRVCPGCGGFGENWVAHFAGFPTELPRRAILAATSENGACVTCGAPWRRVTKRTAVVPTDYAGKWALADPQAAARRVLANVNARRQAGEAHDNPFPAPETVRWEPSCKHADADVEPCVVLDVFLGSGTTSVAAKALGRWSIGVELNPLYAALARRRIALDVPKWARPWRPTRPTRAPKPLPAQIPLLEALG